MELDKYQRLAHRTARSRDIEVFTLGLFGEAGSVASTIKKLKRDNPAGEAVKAEIATELGDVLWYLAEIATHYGLSLSDVAASNLNKTKFLFEGEEGPFDQAAPEAQRLPEHVVAQFSDENHRVRLLVNGEVSGDVLDDNAHDPDGYRFHDVFHLAYMTRLGWSPVMRKLLGRKRKYNAAIDKVEDGARAIFLEEGISVFVFNQNVRTPAGVSSFSDRGNIPFSVLAALKTMTIGLEVSRRDIGSWREAIALGFGIFDQLAMHGGGTVTCDLGARTLTFEPPNGSP